MEKKKREEWSQSKETIDEKTARNSPRQCAMKSSFIHTVSSKYQCIYSIPWGFAIVFKNNKAHT